MVAIVCPSEIIGLVSVDDFMSNKGFSVASVLTSTTSSSSVSDSYFYKENVQPLLFFFKSYPFKSLTFCTYCLCCGIVKCKTHVESSNTQGMAS